ncbi:MAG: hypothetical protein BGO14_03135 [Chlamydiales bacterium 38-26]|nr:hypothetical protein [Chlamydiales bacterium]OJV09332.1 MAG: hypothetical protein BGO14_03135 [Chlamydiales bacterium 38-26]
MENLIVEFDHYLAGIAWNSWSELGVAGTDRFYENCLIQPEELIILTAIIAQHDPRLRDEALDWSSRYHQWISVSRLRTFLKDMDPDVMHSFSQFAAVLNSVSSAKWPSAEERSDFAIRISEKSLLPGLESPSLLMLRLRNLFGPGAKADMLTHFLTRNGMQFSASDLREVGYSKRSLITALDHLATSGILVVTNVRNKKNYELSKPKELQVIIGKLPKIAPPWIKILHAIIAIRAVIPEIQNSSKITKGVILRNCLIKIEPLLPFFISPILRNHPDFERDWKSVVEIFKAFQQGNFHMQFEVYNDFDKIVIQLLRDLHRVDDCVDGIEMIQSEKEFKVGRHGEIYKECYQLFLSFISDLNVSLKHFFEFPFHKMMDESLADISYRFSNEKLPQLLEKMKQIQSIDRITNVQTAVRQYQIFMPEFDVLRQFIYTFRKRLEDLYFINTDIYLLSLPTTLYKRKLVLDLFSKNNN